MQLINEIVHSRDRVPIFDSLPIEQFAVYGILIVLSFFFTNTTEEANRLELGRMNPISSNSLIAFSISSLYTFVCI